jgi:ribosomal protein S18 acetylase RimI-like enzyme
MIPDDADAVEPIATPHGALSRRPETTADAAFLLSLHESVKGADLAPIPEPMRRQLLDMQFRAMAMGYRAAFPAARYDIITLDEASIGRLISDGGQGWFHIVHIALLPEWRDRGIGTALMTSILEHPKRLGFRCEATVAQENLASLRLWTRLGFAERGRDDANLFVEWRPA